MKKVLIIGLSIFLIYIIIRLLFSYTIFNIPYMFGTETYVGGCKYDFPICIVNPIKAKGVKRDITNYLKNNIEEETEANKEGVSAFFGILKDPTDFNIVSINTDDKVENSFLLQIKGNPQKRCVVFIDKKSKQLLRFGF